jgi:hypothetical protein
MSCAPIQAILLVLLFLHSQAGWQTGNQLLEKGCNHIMIWWRFFCSVLLTRLVLTYNFFSIVEHWNVRRSFSFFFLSKFFLYLYINSHCFTVKIFDVYFDHLLTMNFLYFWTLINWTWWKKYILVF